MFVGIMILITGIYLALCAMAVETENMKSFIVFKAVPFLLGIFCILQSLNEFGIMTLNW